MLTFVCSGGIADSVSKWVFRQNMAPEHLKEILQRKETEGAVDKKEEKEDREIAEEKVKNQEDADRTAGDHKYILNSFSNHYTLIYAFNFS